MTNPIQVQIDGHSVDCEEGTTLLSAARAAGIDVPTVSIEGSPTKRRPHLHIQATRSASGDWWHGEPRPLRFAGRFPVRNQVVDV